MSNIEVTVTRKVLVSPEVAREIAEGFLEYIDAAGFLEGLMKEKGPSYKELAAMYIRATLDGSVAAINVRATED